MCIKKERQRAADYMYTVFIGVPLTKVYLDGTQSNVEQGL
jgi:hypothetical protein